MNLFEIWCRQIGLQEYQQPLGRALWDTYEEDDIYLQDYSDGNVKVCFRDSDQRTRKVVNETKS